MTSFQKALLSWFAEYGRDLPWRKTYDPYHIWISEMMLQQTQMERGVIYFKRWLQVFPTIEAIATATEDAVLKLWEGLGYYARARHIHQAAKILVRKYDSVLPASYDDLLALPGIGKYTANAIMSLAFNHDHPVVDANVERVFSRLFDLTAPVKDKETQNFLWQKAQSEIPSGKARYFNQALMELGALVCLKSSPYCHICPVHVHCLANERGTVNDRPVKLIKKKNIHIKMATGILCHQNKIFIQKRLPQGVWANLWEFPGGRVEMGETPEQAVVREFKEETGFDIMLFEKITAVRHSYMHYLVTLHCFFCGIKDENPAPVLSAAQEYRWVCFEDLEQFAFPAGHRKLIETLSLQRQKML